MSSRWRQSNFETESRTSLLDRNRSVPTCSIEIHNVNLLATTVVCKTQVYCVDGFDKTFKVKIPGKGLKIGKGALECAVCLNEFGNDETLRLLLKCDRVFHPECIDAWLASHTTCPVCRANLTSDSNHPATDGNEVTEAQNQDSSKRKREREADASDVFGQVELNESL
ncbi:hypothetical protein IFM89_009761 [Coptis chinensis]|uniref:RING-type E3 ubiquitin transferase n=1 Tax=Coptis chinensis TaxID=261450 RepID=A0A835LUW7_9MAGN|nr:hypothetical protein IFM89_009761 [Coptis chinensis]